MSYSWFGCFFFFLLFGCICICSSESTTAVSYARHCSYVVPEYTATSFAAGVYKVEGFLSIRLPDSPQYWHLRSERYIRFAMNGFWSEKSRNLCMIGSSSWNGTNRDAVLKLNFEDESPTIYTSVASGILESTASANDLTCFDPVLIFTFPAASSYNYSLVEKGMFSDVGEDESSSSSLRARRNRVLQADQIWLAKSGVGVFIGALQGLL